MFLTSQEIRTLCQTDKPLITPFSEFDNSGGIISRGLSQGSYDISLSEQPMEIFDGNGNNYQCLDGSRLSPYFDPKDRYHPTLLIEAAHTAEEIEKGRTNGNKSFFIPPKQMVLATSVEEFNIPDDITGFLYCKSTYARLGLSMAPTVLKSGWSGKLVLEIYNQSSKPVLVYANEGIASVYFAKHTGANEDTYSGKFQNQDSIIHTNPD